MEYILVFFLSVIGAIIQSITGFGNGIFVMSFFPLFLPTFSAAAISSLSGSLLSLLIGRKYYKKINFKFIIGPIIFFMVTNTIAISLSVSAANSVLKRALGVFLICLSIYFIFFNNKIKIKANIFTGAIAGLLGGLFNGFFNMGGPPMVLYMLETTEDTEEYMGTIQFYFFVTSIASIVTRALHGAYTGEVLSLSAVAVVALILGMTIGGFIFKKMKAETMRRMVYFFMIITGGIMLVTG